MTNDESYATEFAKRLANLVEDYKPYVSYDDMENCFDSELDKLTEDEFWDEKPIAVVAGGYMGDPKVYCWYSEELPDEGSCGGFAFPADAAEDAMKNGYAVRDGTDDEQVDEPDARRSGYISPNHNAQVSKLNALINSSYVDDPNKSITLTPKEITANTAWTVTDYANAIAGAAKSGKGTALEFADWATQVGKGSDSSPTVPRISSDDETSSARSLA